MTLHLSYEIIFHVGGLKLDEIDTLSPGLKAIFFKKLLITEITFSLSSVPSSFDKSQVPVDNISGLNVKRNDLRPSILHYLAIVTTKCIKRLEDVYLLQRRY